MRPGLAEELDYGRSLYNCLRMSVELIKAGKNLTGQWAGYDRKVLLPLPGEKEFRYETKSQCNPTGVC